MKDIIVDLPHDIDILELHIFADEHIGDINCDSKRLTERIEAVKNNPNAYAILNGDIIDNANKLSIGDVEDREYNIMGQVQRAIDFFSPIKDKIICMTNGNHEARSYNKEGIDLSRLVAMSLGIEDKYSADASILFIKFGYDGLHAKSQKRKKIVTAYVTHGAGSGRRVGSKANKLEDLGSNIDTDIYIRSHTHQPIVFKEGFIRVDRTNMKHKNVTKTYINTASNLDYNGGYGVVAEYKPNSKDTPIIYCDWSNDLIWATL